MTDELQTTLPALSDLAVEVFGDEFHGISHSEQVENEQFSARMRGYQALAQEKARELDAGVNRLESTSDDDPGTEPRWTTDDVKVLSTFQTELLRFQGDYQRAVQEFSGVDINALEKTDKARAVQVRTGSMDDALKLLTAQRAQA